jgi:hypothetical protein
MAEPVCITSGLCYSQYLDRRDGTNPVTKGCVKYFYYVSLYARICTRVGDKSDWQYAPHFSFFFFIFLTASRRHFYARTVRPKARHHCVFDGPFCSAAALKCAIKRICGCNNSPKPIAPDNLVRAIEFTAFFSLSL